MRVIFRGVRGSLPAPLTPEQVRSKIAAIVQRIRPADLQSAESRERFLSRLPPYLFGTTGGNTTCVEVRTDDDRLLILDGGTGLRVLGAALAQRRDPTREFPILLTHFHWDHLQGIPFFGPAWVKGNRLTFLSPDPSMEKTVREQMKPPYFPVTMEAMQAKVRFLCLNGEKLRFGDTEIRWRKMNHPGGAYAYRISENGKSLVFATDSEVTERDFISQGEGRSFFERADLLILDSQYTLEESFSKFDFGHTSYTMAVNLASEWNVRRLVLFHHEPRYDDRKIFGIARRAQWHRDQLGESTLEVSTAVEGTEIVL